MTLLESILAGVVVAFVSGLAGILIASKHKVSDETCGERRESCMKLVNSKLANIENAVSKIWEKLDSNKP